MMGARAAIDGAVGWTGENVLIFLPVSVGAAWWWGPTLAWLQLRGPLLLQRRERWQPGRRFGPVRPPWRWPSSAAGDWRWAAWRAGSQARTRGALCAGGAIFFLQDDVLSGFGAQSVRLHNALFGGFLLRVEPPVAFEPPLAPRAWFCGGLTVSCLCCRRLRSRSLVLLLVYGPAPRVAYFREPAVDLRLRRRAWRGAAFVEVIKGIGSGLANGRGIYARDDSWFPLVFFFRAFSAGFFFAPQLVAALDVLLPYLVDDGR